MPPQYETSGGAVEIDKQVHVFFGGEFFFIRHSSYTLQKKPNLSIHVKSPSHSDVLEWFIRFHMQGNLNIISEELFVQLNIKTELYGLLKYCCKVIPHMRGSV